MCAFLQKITSIARCRARARPYAYACALSVSTSILRITGPSEYEQVIKHSKFIALATPVSSAREALRCVQLSKAAHPKANHHCWAFSISGNGTSGSDSMRENAETIIEADAEADIDASSMSRHSDDGEPSGTAGRPILTAIEAERVADVVVVVVRYFGGVQLGTGGLSRAYGSSARAALQLAHKRTAVDMSRIQVRLPAGSCPAGTELDREMLHAVYACMQWMNSSSRKASTYAEESITKISETLEGSNNPSPSELSADKAVIGAPQPRSALAGYVHASEWQCPRDALPVLRARLHSATRGLAVVTVK
jgi:putative IMPACT (imprinted ancient) family translation regulator